MKLPFALAAAFALLFPPALHSETPALRVSAAASLADVLKEVDARFEKESGNKVELNLGASSVLARQIEEGAPADVFFSADEAKMDGLEKKNLIDPATRHARLSNSLVVIVPAESNREIHGARDLPALGRIALGDPKAVPAGVYARGWLEKAGCWNEVASKVVAAENVRAALAAVESGNVDAGVVYKTDANISKKVKVAYEVPAADVPPVIYPVAVVKESRQVQLAKKYLEFLDSAEAVDLFSKAGFVVLPQPVPAGK